MLRCRDAGHPSTLDPLSECPLEVPSVMGISNMMRLSRNYRDGSDAPKNFLVQAENVDAAVMAGDVCAIPMHFR
jgi:hypothetical protein